MEKKSAVLFLASIENLKILKYHAFSRKHQSFLLFAVNVGMKMKNI